MLGKKKFNSTKNDQDWDFWKYDPNLVIQKVHSYLFVKHFVVIFFNSFFFSMYHILSPYKKILVRNHNKKCIWKLMQNLYYDPYVHFKSPLLYDLPFQQQMSSY
jgi:hypothetical protein